MTRVPLLPALLACLLACGCASVPAGKPDRRDPLESYNRWMFGVNDAIDRGVVQPVARGYVRMVPQPMRRGIGNFFDNLSYPRTIANDVLQAKLTDGARDTARLVLNSVLGLGFFDPAARLGLERHDEDFGQTLGTWGMPAGPYLMLPLLGPSTLRDAFGRVPDEYGTGRHYVKDNAVKWSLAALDGVDKRASLFETESVLRESFDRYAFLRNAWLQRREYLVRDGEVDAPSFDDEPPADAPATPRR